MSHQDQLKLQEYRNYVKGGLSFKYFKDGIQQYAEQIVLSEHSRILQQAGVSSGQICVACNLREIRPLHKCQPNSITGRSCCPLGQKNCNCIFSAKKKKCPMKICDVIYEEILKSHASSPPCPEWRNTDITKWTTNLWEIAKCFINAPGYSDKQSAADIDIAGLLHLFVNNIDWRQYFPTIDADVFAKMRERRHLLFHSPSSTLETAELNTIIHDMISILQVENLKTSKGAFNAVQNLNDFLLPEQLKNEDFYITTHCEADVLESIRADVCIERAEIRKLVEDARHEISTNQEQAVKRIITAQEEGNAEISSKLKQANEDITEQRIQASELMTLKREQCINDITSSHKQVIDSITSKEKEIFVKLNEYKCHDVNNLISTILEH